jgi:hypothetical protein
MVRLVDARALRLREGGGKACAVSLMLALHPQVDAYAQC